MVAIAMDEQDRRHVAARLRGADCALRESRRPKIPGQQRQRSGTPKSSAASGSFWLPLSFFSTLAVLQRPHNAQRLDRTRFSQASVRAPKSSPVIAAPTGTGYDRTAETLALDSITAPLRHAVFRRIWLASLVSNLGLLIQGVGAAWAMTQMTSSANKVALVQTALMLPIMLISMPAGAIADMHDRRIVAMVSLLSRLTGATALTVTGVAQPRHAQYPAGCSASSSAPAWR